MFHQASCLWVMNVAVKCFFPSFFSCLFVLQYVIFAALMFTRSIAEYLSRDLPYKLLPDDVFVTSGCKDAIQVMINVLARAGSNVLLPRPGFPRYETFCTFSQLKVRHYELLPDKGWEVCLDSIEALTDEKTAAIVVINPGNPCGNVYSHWHLREVRLVTCQIQKTLLYGLLLRRPIFISHTCTDCRDCKKARHSCDS